MFIIQDKFTRLVFPPLLTVVKYSTVQFAITGCQVHSKSNIPFIVNVMLLGGGRYSIWIKEEIIIEGVIYRQINSASDYKLHHALILFCPQELTVHEDMKISILMRFNKSDISYFVQYTSAPVDWAAFISCLAITNGCYNQIELSQKCLPSND